MREIKNTKHSACKSLQENCETDETLEELQVEGHAENAAATELTVENRGDLNKTWLNSHKRDYNKHLSQVFPGRDVILLLIFWGNWLHIKF